MLDTPNQSFFSCVPPENSIHPFAAAYQVTYSWDQKAAKVEQNKLHR